MAAPTKKSAAPRVLSSTAATRSPGRTPRARRPLATRTPRSHACAKVSVRSRVTRATRSAWNRADWRMRLGTSTGLLLSPGVGSVLVGDDAADDPAGHQVLVARVDVG